MPILNQPLEFKDNKKQRNIKPFCSKWVNYVKIT